MKFGTSSKTGKMLAKQFDLGEHALREKGKEGLVEGEKQWEYTISVHPLELEVEDQETSVEVPSMLKLDLSLVHNTGQRKKTFYLNRWYRR